jgi:hypothetical protein
LSGPVMVAGVPLECTHMTCKRPPRRLLARS